LDIIRFSLADTVVDPKLGPTADQVAAVDGWRATSGLSFHARDSFVTVITDSSDERKVRQRRDDLIDILSIRPLSSQYWLLLAETGLNPVVPLSELTEALRLSALTGANEGVIMGRRALFGLSQWEVLPAELQTRAVTDLVANPKPLSIEQISWLRQALADKAKAVRDAVRTELLRQGFSAKGASVIGL